MPTVRATRDSRLAAAERIWRDNRCLKDSSIVLYREWVQRFRAYCGARRLKESNELTLAGVSRFAGWYARRRKINAELAFCSSRSALGTWALALKTLGESLPPWTATAAPRSLSPLMQEFADHLRQHRGNPDNTIRKKAWHVAMFNAFLRARDRRSQTPRLQDIDAFVVHCRKRYARTTVADVCSTLRSYMRFLRASGRMHSDLAASVLAPIVRVSERPHRALPWEDVQRILRAINRASPCGRRDYALLLMMSTYGLGAGEVIRLRLDDIDWRAATLHVVRPKTGVGFLLPLMPAVARALVSYLRHGRPKHVESRRLFVTMRAPHKPLACAVTIRHILHTAARRAGVSAGFLGTHVLRHTHACRQMELGTAPKLIGDILGHRDPESTSAYLRVSIQRLRELALAVPR